jgi:hypothetical protein
MKCAIGMVSGSMIYVLRFIKIGSGIQNLLSGIHIQTQQGDLIKLVLYFVNKEGRLKTRAYIHALSGIKTSGLNARSVRDRMRLGPRAYSDQLAIDSCDLETLKARPHYSCSCYSLYTLRVNIRMAAP